MLSAADTRMLNEALFEQLTTPGLEKRANDALNDFTRTRMREDGFARRILPPIQVNNDDLDRQVDTDKPVKIFEREPGSPAAVSLPFGTLPINAYIRGQRWMAGFDRIMTVKWQKDVDELRTYIMDIRQVLSDNSLKDLLEEEDRKLIAAIDAVMIGPDVPSQFNGNCVQWKTIVGGITRETVQEARKVMPRGPSRLEAHTALINNITIKEIEKWYRDEMGGDYSQDVMKNGWSESNFAGMTWIISIKRNLIPDDSMYMFSDPRFIGKMLTLEDTTMFVERKAFMIEFFSYETIGGGLGHTGGLARVDFA